MIITIHVIERLATILVCLALAWAELRQAVKVRHTSYAWVKFSLGFFGFYWAGLYTYLLLACRNLTMNELAIYFRPAFTMFMALVAAGAIQSLGRMKK